MKSFKRFQLRAFVCLAVVLVGLVIAQTNSVQSPLEIVGFKIGTDYYPMLDSKPSTMTADNPDFPRPPGEVAMRQNRRGGMAERQEQIKARGKSRTTIQIISDAQWVKFTVKNTSTALVKAVVWDFAFPRYEQGGLVLRQTVVSREDIKPGGKRTLKFQLPPNATRCKAVSVAVSDDPDENKYAQESVCGPGFDDPTKLKQPAVLIRQIEFADGQLWQRPDQQ